MKNSLFIKFNQNAELVQSSIHAGTDRKYKKFQEILNLGRQAIRCATNESNLIRPCFNEHLKMPQLISIDDFDDVKDSNPKRAFFFYFAFSYSISNRNQKSKMGKQ